VRSRWNQIEKDKTKTTNEINSEWSDNEEKGSDSSQWRY
jgi:hypothetical protein